MALFCSCLLYKVVLILESVDEILDMSTKMKSCEQNFLVVLFIQLLRYVKFELNPLSPNNDQHHNSPHHICAL